MVAELSDEVVLKELGSRLSRLRLNRNWPQALLAREAGISKRTLERLENGQGAIQLPALLRVSRVLGILPNLDAFIPEVKPSPRALFELQGKLRRHARRRTSPAGKPPESTSHESL